MSKVKVGIVNYGIGNHTSVQRCMKQLGFRSYISQEISKLDTADILILPGVGAYPTAMHRLHSLKLVDYLQQYARDMRPIIGICLGMQLLAESSTEHKLTPGLGLVPGIVEAIEQPRWHIGWNTIETNSNSSKMEQSDNCVMYFNHSYSYQGPEEFITAKSRIREDSRPITAAIERNNVIGLQFHPEKSQKPGIELLSRLINNSREKC